jgi:hypothetical protein
MYQAKQTDSWYYQLYFVKDGNWVLVAGITLAKDVSIEEFLAVLNGSSVRLFEEDGKA